jgi:hypothetical protein
MVTWLPSFSRLSVVVGSNAFNVDITEKVGCIVRLVHIFYYLDFYFKIAQLFIKFQAPSKGTNF